MKKISIVIYVIVVLIISMIFLKLNEWTNNFVLVALFVPINDSSFEMGKAIFYPFLIVGSINSLLVNKENYWVKMCLCAVIGVILNIILSLPFLFLSYYEVYIRYLIIIVSIIIMTLLFSYFQNDRKKVFPVGSFEGIFTTITVAFAFSVFTFFPPDFIIFNYINNTLL